MPRGENALKHHIANLADSVQSRGFGPLSFRDRPMNILSLEKQVEVIATLNCQITSRLHHIVIGLSNCDKKNRVCPHFGLARAPSAWQPLPVQQRCQTSAHFTANPAQVMGQGAGYLISC